MKIVESVIATTHVDRHGDCCSREALEDAAAQARSAFIPMIFNHDPRIPPLGRTVDAQVRQLADGEYALVTILEVFEPGDVFQTPRGDREIRLREFKQDKVTIVHDRSYGSSDDQLILAELAEYPEIRLEKDEKKAFEPISVLLLALGVAATALATGFLVKMGSDTWDYVKPKLAGLLSRKRMERSDFLFIFELQVKRETGLLSIQCILVNPSSDQFEDFWSNGLALLDQRLPKLLSIHPDIRKVILHYVDGKLEPGFAVRKDCTALNIKNDTLKDLGG